MRAYKIFGGDYKEGSDAEWLEKFLFNEIEVKRPVYSIKDCHEAVVTPSIVEKVRLHANENTREVIGTRYFLYIAISESGDGWDDFLEIDIDKDVFSKVTQVVEVGDNAYFECVDV